MQTELKKYLLLMFVKLMYLYLHPQGIQQLAFPKIDGARILNLHLTHLNYLSPHRPT